MPATDYTQPQARAVFLDRDDTLMRDIPYCRDPELVELLPGVRDGLLRLQQSGWLLFIVTNQSGIARGYCTHAEVRAVNSRLCQLLQPVKFTGVYYSPDSSEQHSTTRKPAPGMLLEAARTHNLHLPSCWMVGDRPTDVACGHNAGCRTIWIPRDPRDCSDPLPTHKATDFTQAVQIILSETA